MKGRYGRNMNVYGHILPGAITVSRYANKVEPLKNPNIRKKLKVISWYQTHEENLSKTARRFGYTRKTIRNWIQRHKEKGLHGLIDKSRKPKTFREPSTSNEIIKAVIETRKKYPAWSKYKIQILLKRKGLRTSASTIGRILKKKKLIKPKVSRKKYKASKNPKRRYPKCLSIKEPGDLIQMDCKEIVATGGVTHFQFTAIDVFTKLRVLDVYASQCSRNMKSFLKKCKNNFPFRIKAIQTDNGKEFLGDFYRELQNQNIPQYFIHPHCPKENTYVERSHESDEYEFYQQGNVCIDRGFQARKVYQWNITFNEVRPHQALDYMTPQEFYESWRDGRLSNLRKFIISLQT